MPAALGAALRATRPDPDHPGRLRSAADRLADARALDPASAVLRRAVRALPLGGARDALHGRWLGHPLHPALIQLPAGCWASAAVLDLLPGTRRGASVLVGAGLAGAGPAAVAGWVDWAELHPSQRRVGLAHAAANIAGVLLYGASLTARLRGRHGRGRLLGFAGLAAVGPGAWLGGHLTYRHAAGVNRAEDVPHVVPAGWHPLGAVADFPVGTPVRRSVGEVPVVVVRESGGEVHVLADRCNHQSGPLSQGRVVDGCVVCPWHGSAFRLVDGGPVRGPAVAPQPAFEARTVDGGVQARYRAA